MATKRPQSSSSQGEERQSKQAKAESVRPFHEPHEQSDIILIVEDIKLHVHKWLLGAYSKVFKRMFEPGFQEHDAKKIPLPEKKLDPFVKFLKQMYPVTSLEPITDETIVDILPLADEYQVEHILRKCRLYMESQLTSQGENLTTDQKLLYLWMSDLYEYRELRDRLVVMAAETDLPDLKKSQHYPSLSLAATKNVMLKRCEKLEGENAKLKKENKAMQACLTRNGLASSVVYEEEEEYPETPPEVYMQDRYYE